MSKIREDEKVAMMERNRDARRSSMPAVNGGGGLTRRRQQRTTNLRDSPEEDRDMEMQEPPRLRDRGIRKDEDRDRDRSSLRSKRRRGDRLMHGSNREDGDDTSEESTDNEEDDEDEDATVVVRLPPSNSLPTPSSSSSIQQQLQQQGNQHHVRKSSSFPAKTVRPPPPATWKVAEEVIGVSVPRKARTSSMKRSQECWVSGEMTHRQASTSPARPSPSSATAVSQAAAISPSSSNVSVRKKKPISVSKHRPPKMTKSSAASSSIQEIEIEVAEVLYGMTRQAPPSSNNKEESSSKVESKETNGLSTEARPQTPMAATVPKRKRPRPKIDEESPSRMESEVPSKTEETAAGSTSPRSEKMLSVSPAVENGVGSSAPMTDGLQDSDLNGLVEGKEQSRVKEEAAVTLASKSKEADSEVKTDEVTTQAARETLPANESPQEEKFNIDLMAPPPLPEKSSEEKSLAQEKKIVVEYDTLNREAAENVEKSSKNEVLMPPDDRNAGKLLAEEFSKRKQQQILKEKAPESQLEQDKDGLTIGSSSNKRQQQVPKQQLKQSARVEPKQEKPVQSASLPLPVSMPGWPGGFPYFGYVGQGPSLQAVLPMDGSTSGSAKTLPAPPHLIQSQPMPRPKRCLTHLYIAQNIHYHQQIARMNPLWPSPSATAAVVPAATAPVYGGAAKQYNLNSVPPSDSSAAILGNSLQVGGFPQRSLDKSTPAAVAMVYTGPPPIEKGSASPALAATNSSNAANAYMEQAAQAKQQFLIQQSQSGASPAPHNMIHGPAFIFPISQQPSSVANHRLGGASPSLKSNAPVSNAPASSGSLTPGHSTSATTTLSFNYPGLSPNDAPGAQYMAIVPNNATYSFPIAAAQVGGPPSYRGAGGATAASPGGQTAIPFMPFLTPPQQQQLQQKQWQHQLQQQQQQQQQQLVQKQSMNQQLIQMQQLSSSSQSHPKPTTSAGSSTSQKHTHHQSQHRQQQHLGPPTHDDSPSTADSSSSSRVSQAQKSIYGTQNFAAMSSMHSPQNFASISSPRAGGGAHNEDKNQQQAMNLSPQAAYAMSFAPFGGGFTAATGAATPAGLDFPAIVQNPAPFQDLPEVPRHGYQIATAAAAAAVALQQHKKAAHLEEGKSGGDPRSNANVATTTEEGKKNNAASVSHSLSFSRPGNDPSPVSPSNILNALSENVNNARALNSSTASGSAMATSASNPPSPQQQQQMIQFRKQQQQVLQYQQLQHHQMQMINMKNSATHNSGAPASTMGARFPQGGLQGFPPSLIQQGGGNTDAAISLQWKAAAAASGMRTTTPPAALAASSATTTSSSSAKNQQIPQHQQLQSNKPLRGAHQTHISFGVTSSNKPLGGAGSPQNSLSKTSAASGGGENSENSPRTSSGFKPGQPTGSIQQQQAAAAASLNKSSSLSSPIPNMNNMTTTSILGHHLHIIPSSTSTTSTTTNKSQHSQLQQSQKQSCFQQQQQPPPHIFNNPYIQQQASSSVAGGTFTYRDEQAHQLIRERQEEHKSRSNSSVEASPSVTGCTVTYQEQIEQLQLQQLHHQAELEKQESKSRSNSSVEVGGSNPAHGRQVDQVDHMKQQQQQLEQVKQQQQKSNHAAAAAELLHKRQLEMVKQKSNQAATELHKSHQKAMQQGQPSPRQQIELEILKQQQQNNNNKSTTQQAKASSTTSQSYPPANHAVIMQLQKQLHQNNLPTQQGKTATATTSTATTQPNNVTVIQRQHLENYEQIWKQQHQNSTSSGMLSLSSSSASPVCDSTAGKTPGSVKAQQYPAGAFMSSRPPVMAAGFPYIHTMPPPSSAPGKLSSAAATDQKQPTATRKDNVHASWKPEKR